MREPWDSLYVRVIVRGWVRALLGLGFGFSAGPAWADVTGQEVAAGTASIDITEAQLQLMAAQSRYGQGLTYVGGTTRWTPARAILNDGQRVPANISRNQLNFGYGYGTLGDWALFAGASFDFIAVKNAAFRAIPNFDPGGAGQAAAFLGVAVADVQLSLGGLISGVTATPFDRDLWGNFQTTRKDQATSFRPGTPYPQEEDEGGFGRSGVELAAYDNRSGAFAALIWSDTGGERRLVDTRANLQPLRGLPQSLLDTAGIPALGYRRLNTLVDYYEQAKAARALTENPAPASEQVEDDYSHEIEAGTDDLAGLGVRWRVAAKVSPDAEFRRAEAGWVDAFEISERLAVRAGARSTAYRLLGKTELAADAFAALALRSTTEDPTGGVHFAASYSYNSPDSTTFIPLPHAHVFGLQLVMGVPETSRPLIPMIRAADPRQFETKTQKHGGKT